MAKKKKAAPKKKAASKGAAKKAAPKKGKAVPAKTVKKAAKKAVKKAVKKAAAKKVAKPAPAPVAAPAATPAAAPASGGSGGSTSSNSSGDGDGSPARPWRLKTPPGSSEFTAFRDPAASPPALVVRVGSTELRYQLRCIDDLHAMLKARADWMTLGSADEQKDAADGTVEAWGRAASNPVGGWYGLKKGLRGRFGMYVPPVLEVLGLAEVEHQPKNNRMRAK